MKTSLKVGLLALCLAGSSVAKAEILVSDSTASFDSTFTQSGSTLTFEGLDTGTNGYTAYFGPQTISGVTFNGSVAIYAVTTGLGANLNDLSTSYWGDGTGTLTVTLPTGTTAFGANFISGAATDGTATLDFYLAGNNTSTPDETISVVDGAVSNSLPTVFAGFSSTNGDIAKVVFHKAALPGLDNFVVGTYSAVPEPSTYALLTGSVLMLFAMARRSRKSSAL